MTHHSQLAIHARGLTRRYRRSLRSGWGSTTAVDQLDLSIPAGSVYGLLGPNGAGKTTTIHMLLGLVRPTSGTVTVFGQRAGAASARTRVGFVPEKFELPGFMTARSFLQLHARLLSMPRSQAAVEVDRCLERLSLLDRADDVVDTFSKGMQQRLAIAQAILGTPALVVLDEPTSALDPIGRRDVRELVLELRAGGTTVLFNSHLLAEVEQVCDEVAILERGRLVSAHAVGGAAADAGGGDGAADRLLVELQLLEAPQALVAAVAAVMPDAQLVDPPPDGTALVRGTVAARTDVAAVADAAVGAGGRIVGLDASGESLEALFMRVVGARDSEVSA